MLYADACKHRLIEGVNCERRRSAGVVQATTMFHQRLGNVEAS